MRHVSCTESSGAIGSCNLNLLPDSCDISSGASADVNTNGIPDECETITCPADYDGDGTLNSDDFFAFLSDFFAGNADFNDDGLTNSADFFDFLSAFFAGCP